MLERVDTICVTVKDSKRPYAGTMKNYSSRCCTRVNNMQS